MIRTFVAVLVGLTLGFAANYAAASRNSSGTMSAANGPYISGTVISSSAVNTRFSDIENELTDSLSRSGKGGMSAALKGTDGTVAAPSFSFTNEPGTGLYRATTNTPAMSVNGTQRQSWTTSGSSITGALSVSSTLGVTGATTLSSTLGVTGDTTLSGKLGVGGAPSFPLDVTYTSTAGGTSESGLKITNTAGSSNYTQIWLNGNRSWSVVVPGTFGSFTGGLAFIDNTAGRTPLVINSSGTTITQNGLQIGSSGTAISASYRGSVTPNTTVAANSCASLGSVTLTGASPSADCIASPSTLAPNTVAYTCAVTTDTCTVFACNPTGAGIAVNTGVVRCRVFN